VNSSGSPIVGNWTVTPDLIRGQASGFLLPQE